MTHLGSLIGDIFSSDLMACLDSLVRTKKPPRVICFSNCDFLSVLGVKIEEEKKEEEKLELSLKELCWKLLAFILLSSRERRFHLALVNFLFTSGEVL